MKLVEYAKIHGIENDENWRNHFRTNIALGRLPVAIVSCPKCDEIIWDYGEDDKCPECSKAQMGTLGGI